jgi:ppGpp synthetase/RelA/SpoT-type nucleotidyltranferase
MAERQDAAPREPVDPGDPAQTAIATYAAAHDDLVLAGEEAVQLVTSVLDEAGINYLTVSGRTKSVASFAEKATRSRDGERLYTDPLREIGDQLGVRVITYVRDDVAAVADLLADQVVVADDRDLGRETASEGRFGYASRHLQIVLDPAREGQAAYAHLPGRNVQVQIRTVLQHAWAEFEHDIRYKGTVPAEHTHDFDRRFTLAAGLLELADQEFATIRDRLRGPAPAGDHVPATASDEDPRLDARELAAFLAGQYDDAGWSRSDHYAWVSGLLLELGITSLDELGDVLRAADEETIRERMDYRYPPGAVRRLDDALLATYGARYVALHGNAHRAAALQTRLEKLSGDDAPAAAGP